MISHSIHTGKAASAAQVQTSPGEAKAQAALSKLSPGQTIQGRVVSVTEGDDEMRTAQIDLGGRTTVSAKLQEGMQLNPGQSVSFQVKSTASGTISLNPLYQNTAAQSAAMKALNAASLPLNDSMKQLVLDMMDAGLPVNRESLLQMSRLLMEFPATDPSALVQMKSLNIPLTPENITQFENYRNYEHQIMSSIDGIMDELPQTFEAMVRQGGQAQANDMYGALMKLFSGGEETEEAAAQAADAGSAASGSVPSGAPDTQAQLQNIEVRFLGENRPAQAQEAVPAAPPEETAAKAASQSASDKALAAIMAAMHAEGADVVVQEAAGRPNGVQSAAYGQEFVSLLQQLGVSKEQLEELLNAPDGASQDALLRTLSKLYEETGHGSEELENTWTKLFSGKDFTKLLQDSIANQWLLKPEEVEKGDNIARLYDRLNRQTRELAHVLSSAAGGTGTPLMQNVSSLSSNLQFMNQLNQMFQYVQLPLKMANQNAHGDLYVYTNKRNLASRDGDVSAILHLDMEHLGPLDVYVKMHGQHVSTNFYLADDGVMDLIDAHIDELNERLKGRGYSMEARMLLQDDKTSEDAAVAEMLKIAPSSVGTAPQTAFDARA